MIKKREHAIRGLLDGMSRASRAVGCTMGPYGKNVCIDHLGDIPQLTNDGATVMRYITDLPDDFERMGAQLLDEASQRTNVECGDGTSSTVVIAEAIVREALRLVIAGHDPKDIADSIEEATRHAVWSIGQRSRTIDDHAQMVQIALVSSKNQVIAETVASVLLDIGTHGLVRVEESATGETHVHYEKGFWWEKGFLSSNFVTNMSEGTCELDDPLIWVTDDVVDNIRHIVPVMELAFRARRPLLVICQNCIGEALTTAVRNKHEGTLRMCIVKMPGFGLPGKQELHDIAIAVGAAYDPEVGNLALAGVDGLGSAGRVVVDHVKTQLLDPKGDPQAIAARIAYVRSQKEREQIQVTRAKLELRLARLGGVSAIVRVGGATDAEMRQIKSRYDDAFRAVRTAVEHGIVPSTSTLYTRVGYLLQSPIVEGDLGSKLLGEAMTQPLRWILRNVDRKQDRIIETAERAEGQAYDLVTDKFVPAFEGGLVDSTRVAIVALENASSLAKTVLLSSVAIAPTASVLAEERYGYMQDGEDE